MPRLRDPALILLAACLLASSAPAGAGLNPLVTLPLHARLTSGSCSQYAPVDCLEHRPTVNVPPATDIVVYLLFFNYVAVAGVQTAFDWDSSWTLNDVLCNCRPNCIDCCMGFDPSQPGGPVTGTIAAFFTCVNGPALTPVARFVFTTGTGGCFYQVQSAYPFGDHVVDCLNGIDQIDAGDPRERLRLGKVCAGEGGWDACDPVVPVEPATWGQIKRSYE